MSGFWQAIPSRFGLETSCYVHENVGAHMIKPVYFVKPFDLTAAVALIAITSVIGYVFGFLGALTWNRLQRR
jgi:hypothetical protein